MFKHLLQVTMLLFFLTSFLLAGTTGKISGVAIDKQTGEPMVGMNVIIEGTFQGASTDLDGDYFIINIVPGKYTVTASMIGYKSVSVTNVQIGADLTTKLHFEMEPEILEAETITITAEKPLIQRDETFTQSITTADQIATMPVNSANEILGYSGGLVVFGQGSYDTDEPEAIHVRGGRSNELLYMIDGFYVRDPLLGGQASDIPDNSIQDLSFITGTFNAEYGEAMSGVVNMVTKEGSENLHGSVRVSSDGFGIEEYDNGTIRTALSLHGPFPFLKNIVSFFVGVDYLDTKTYLHEATSNVHDIDSNPIQRHHTFPTMNRRERYTGNIIINPFRNVKIMLGYTGLNQKQRFYDHLFKEIPDHIGFDYNKSDLYKFSFTHTLNEKTFYVLKVAHFNYNYQHKLKDNLDDIIVPILAPDAFDGTSNYEFYGGYWSQDASGDSLWVISDDNLFRDYTTEEFSILGDITSQIHKNHLIKVGFEYKAYSIKEDYIPFVNEPEYGETHYEEEPFKVSAFAQDKMEFDDFVVNAGLRFDYLDPKTEYVPDMDNPTERVPTDPKYRISPRLGFGFPVSEKIKMHFAYGQFFQFPEFSFLYSRFNYLDPAGVINPLVGFIPRFGNPDLKPQTAIAYEFGSKFIFSQDVVGYMTIFYKDIYDYIALSYVRASPKDYQMFVNLDYANSKGVELGLSKRFSSHYSLSINYTYSQSIGNADKWTTHETELVNASITQQIPPKKTITLEWDQPHRLNFQFDLRWVDNWGLNILGTFGSGLPYTPTDARGKHIGEVNSARKPWSGTVNLRLNKDFHLLGFKQVLYVDVWNLFNKVNVLQVFTSTGKPDDSANPNSSGEDQHRPHWIGPPRQIELGVQVVF